MKTLFTVLAAVAAVTFAQPQARADLAVGEKAPAIVAKSIDGKEWKLADQRGKYVVLEWYNPGCPYVKKFYNPGAMQKQQQELAAQGVVWVSIYSSGEAIAGKMSAEALQKQAKAWKTNPAVTLYDVPAQWAKAYSAKTTPHIFIINPEGQLIYRGAIDSISSGKSEDIAKAENYVTKALLEAKAGKPVGQSVTKPYGCGVKL